MVNLLLGHPTIDLRITNIDNKTCFEAYSDQFGYDEAANIAEKAYLDKFNSESSTSLSKKPFTFPQDFSKEQRENLLSK
jgi:hypothetical protein